MQITQVKLKGKCNLVIETTEQKINNCFETLLGMFIEIIFQKLQKSLIVLQKSLICITSNFRFDRAAMKWSTLEYDNDDVTNSLMDNLRDRIWLVNKN